MTRDEWEELIQQITDEIVDFKGDYAESMFNQGLNLAIGIIYKFWATHTVKEEITLKPEQINDPVSHPSHYTFGRIEVIDAINEWQLDFDRGNAIKYIVRAGRKDPTKTTEDIRKAIFYLEDYVKRLEAE